MMMNKNNNGVNNNNSNRKKKNKEVERNSSENKLTATSGNSVVSSGGDGSSSHAQRQQQHMEWSSPFSNAYHESRTVSVAATTTINDLFNSMSKNENGNTSTIQQPQNVAQDQKRLKNFKRLRDLGRGAFGICSLYKDYTPSQLKKNFVIKRVSLECQSEEQKRQITKEASLLKKLMHPNIIRFHDSFVENEQLYIVMEYLEGGTLDRMIQERKGIRMGQDLVLYYFTQITMAVDYIHAMKVLHRDIKTQNIFLNRKMTIVKVGDFGVSKVFLLTRKNSSIF